MEKLIKSTIKGVGEELDLALFKQFVTWIDKSTLSNVVKYHWYDLPAELRIIAPTMKNIRASDFSGKKIFMQTTMKGLSHQIKMTLWYNFELEESIPDLNQDVRMVSFRGLIFQEKQLYH